MWPILYRQTQLIRRRNWERERDVEREREREKGLILPDKYFIKILNINLNVRQRVYERLCWTEYIFIKYEGWYISLLENKERKLIEKNNKSFPYRATTSQALMKL